MGTCGTCLFGSEQKSGPVQDPPKWTASPPLNQRAQLMKKRDEFWETQPAYGGSPEIWLALRSAIENPDLRAVILESADIRMPKRTWFDVYDSMGYKYDLPQYVLSDPSNLQDG